MSNGPNCKVDQYPLRMPSGMRDRIRQQAVKSRRSMNSEIVHYLDRALAAEETKGPAEAATSPGQIHANPLEVESNERNAV